MTFRILPLISRFFSNSQLNSLSMKAIIFSFALLLAGCGGGNIVEAAAPTKPVAQPSVPTPTPTPTPAPTPSATPFPEHAPLPATMPSGALTPFPDLTIGQYVTLEPGDYDCPSTIPNGVHIIGHGTIYSAAIFADVNLGSQAPRSLTPEVRIFCGGDVVLNDSLGIDISGVIFYFENSGRLILDGVGSSKFEIGINDSPLGLTLKTTAGNVGFNSFPNLVEYNVGGGMLWIGTNEHGVTINNFGNIRMIRVRQFGLDVFQGADTNTVEHIWIRMFQGASGVIFNDLSVLGDVDASGNKIGLLDCDIDSGAPGYCLDFRGYTVGNDVTIGFGIMNDANKIHFQNMFSQKANHVVKLQEAPKVP